MVRYDNLFWKIVTLDNFYKAFHDMRLGHKYNTRSMRMSARIEYIITEVMRELIDGTWRHCRYYAFECRTEVKRRQIHAPCFRDGLVHHALDNVLREIFERKYIFDLYSNRRGKGQHRAVMRVQHFIRKASHRGRVYVLQCDIHKYYDSIDHDVLKHMIRGTIKDGRVLTILDRIIDSYNDDTGKGVPIGALPSQTFANVYLCEFDHFVKETLRVKNYLRFMDDFIIVANSKDELHAWLREIKWYLETQVHLKLNPKTAIYPAHRGVNFCGYRIFKDRILPRKRNLKAARIRFKNLVYHFRRGDITLADVQPRVASFLGYCKHCKARKSVETVLKYLVLSRGR